jgi:FixJ family two-component response regulator
VTILGLKAVQCLNDPGRAGRLSKQIAGDLSISEVTVKVHRSNMMRKMKAKSLPELGRMADKLKLV